MISVGRLAPVRQWDQTLFDDLFANELYPTGLEFRRVEGYPGQTDGCVLLIPGRYWAGHEQEISMAVSRYKWLLLMRVGDEEDWFDVTQIRHDNMKCWVQTPRAGRDYGDARFIGVGYTPYTWMLPNEVPDKDLDVFLSAQRTHQRRIEAFDALKDTPHQSCVIPTEGFTQGLDLEEYMRYMSRAKIAPAPSGAVSVDSFRFWEALESHCVPIADKVSPVDGVTDYWQRLFPAGFPFPPIEDYVSLPGYINDVLDDWPAWGNRVTAWWFRQKREYTHWLKEDLKALGAL